MNAQDERDRTPAHWLAVGHVALGYFHESILNNSDLDDSDGDDNKDFKERGIKVSELLVQEGAGLGLKDQSGLS